MGKKPPAHTPASNLGDVLHVVLRLQRISDIAQAEEVYGTSSWQRRRFGVARWDASC